MDNRVYYGQYSLMHWLELILKGNIILPDYQRFFVWDENRVKLLVETFKKKQFVPPIIIGAFKKDEHTNQNLILDGQQRLTTILLAYLGLFPDSATYIGTIERLPNENDDDVDDDEPVDTILNWSMRNLTAKGKTKADILAKLGQGKYKSINFDVNDEFLKKTFLGFSYLVPHTEDHDAQQQYYSSVFRNINAQGQRLLPQESRASLYFLKNDLEKYFNPTFIKQITIKNFSSVAVVDFVRFLAYLSQYVKEGSTSRVGRGFKSKMEDYYEEYIFSVAGDTASPKFTEFTTIFPEGNYNQRFERLEQTINDLDIPKQFASIIEMDTFLFGLIYSIVFQDKVVDAAQNSNLRNDIDAKIIEFKADEGHRKAPSALKYLRARIDASIEIYNKYLNG
ncbi:DUF262 domain-containing protein [Pedobacter sp. MC2016-15]|uniref:DUF262 domain-containing protein n=1 Tax=Pedobacter sp. MC2016-15 TaxID=2994473 RepID=UPI00224520E4|nr:DUF262 domain-containing protein [Pedobacter sp. MC2016-15]MCX2479334.1 DUF262 domain-containing protein [Pedobacter sp. MC2016-15]